VQKTRDDQHVGDLIASVPAASAPLVAEAWGPGIATNRGGTPVTCWFDPDRGVRATLTVDKKAELRFEPYLPLAKLLGPGPNLAVFDKPFLGLTVADAYKAYAAVSDGKAIELPPTEFEFSDTTLAFFYPREPEKPVKSLSISFGYDKHPKLLADLTAAFEAKWGKPKGANPIDAKSQIYNVKDPHVEIADTTYGTKQITITISKD
jgi:hypothetical protein